MPTVTRPYMSQGPFGQGSRFVSNAGIIRMPIPIIMVITNPTARVCLAGPASAGYPKVVAQIRALAIKSQKYEVRTKGLSQGPPAEGIRALRNGRKAHRKRHAPVVRTTTQTSPGPVQRRARPRFQSAAEGARRPP